MSDKPVSIIRVNDTQKALAQLDPALFNILTLPQIAAEQGQHWQIAITRLELSPDDYYPTPGKAGMVSLHSQAIQKIANAAGISFGATSYTWHHDNPTCSTVAKLQIAPGQWIQAAGTYCLNIDARIEEFRLKAHGKADPKERERAIAELPGLEIRTRKFALQLAETGARSRALRALLNLHGSYSKAEITRPFAVPRLHFSPTGALADAAARLAMAQLFGDPMPAEDEAKARAALTTAGAAYVPEDANEISLAHPSGTRPQDQVIDIPPADQEDNE